MINHSARNRILAVDDDPILLELFRTFVTSDIYEVVAVEDGAKAIELLMAERFDLVVVDMLIPIVDGVQLIAFIRRTWRTRHLPIVVVTSLSDEATRRACRQAGANELLTKPVDWQRLTALLDELLAYAKPRKASSDF